MLQQQSNTTKLHFCLSLQLSLSPPRKQLVTIYIEYPSLIYGNHTAGIDDTLNVRPRIDQLIHFVKVFTRSPPSTISSTLPG